MKDLFFPSVARAASTTDGLRAERADTSAGSILKRTACAAVRLMKIAPAIGRAKEKPQNANLLLWRIKK